MKKILVIDDNKEIRFALSEILVFKGWESYTAESVEEGLELFHSHPIDLVIMDYHMPVINGMIGVKLLRAISEEVPIIVLTVEESQEIADAFIEAGASDFALKPIKAPDLLSRLSVHLNRKQAQRPDSYKTYAKGISSSTLCIIESFMKAQEKGMTISKISKETGLAYQTVHRYLHHLEIHGAVAVEQTYGKVGRPRQTYRWVEKG